jgi:hypothetical protein
MYGKSILLTILLILSQTVSSAQQQAGAPVSEICVESWITGNKIREQVLTFKLDSSRREHTAIVRDVAIGRYKLILLHFPAGDGDHRLEYWAVQLKPVLSEGTQSKEKLGENLLTAEGPGPGKHYFPREDLVGILYPREAPKNAAEKLLGGDYYPVSAKRVIKIQNFYLMIQVTSFKLNETNPKKLDSMNVTIEFRNSYKCENDCK